MNAGTSHPAVDHVPAKPKLLLLRPTTGDQAAFIRFHLQEQIKCLSLHFDVAIVAAVDCDYKRLCDIHKPDITMIEAGAYSAHDRRRPAANVDAYPEIPRIGFLNADAYCESRKVFLSEMSRWGVSTFFTLSVSMAEYTPSIADRLFVWPNFADPDTFRDYGESKVIPVLFTGSMAPHYPWRNQIYKRVSERYPTLKCPHFGWGSRATEGMMYGERYARLLNASSIVPACGTIANEIVRKHFEIPSANACLLAPRTAALEAAGFVDMENCVFADEHDVLDRLDHLFAHPDEIARISMAGARLVRSAHTPLQRDQIHQWLALFKGLRADERIVQPGPFERLAVVPKQSSVTNAHVISGGVDRTLLRKGDEALWAGRYAEAKGLFQRCLIYHAMPEPKLRLVITSLFSGNVDAALRWSRQQVARTLDAGAATPDPVEWAYFALSVLCEGQAAEARRLAASHGGLQHPELDRVRFVVEAATNGTRDLPPEAPGPNVSYTVHHMPDRTVRAWMDDACRMLRACGRHGYAERVAARLTAIRMESGAARSRQESRPAVRDTDRAIVISDRSRLTPAIRRGKAAVKGILHPLEDRLGYFLPYKVSRARADELFGLIEAVCREEHVSAAVVIGARAGGYVTEASLAGVRANPARPMLVLVSTRAASRAGLRKRYGNDEHVLCDTDLQRVTGMCQSAPGLTTVVIVDGSECSCGPHELTLVDHASVVILDDINQSPAFEIHQALAATRAYALFDHNADRQHGFSGFRRHGSDATPVLAARASTSASELS